MRPTKCARPTLRRCFFFYVAGVSPPGSERGGWVHGIRGGFGVTGCRMRREYLSNEGVVGLVDAVLVPFAVYTRVCARATEVSLDTFITHV